MRLSTGWAFIGDGGERGNEDIVVFVGISSIATRRVFDAERCGMLLSLQDEG